MGQVVLVDKVFERDSRLRPDSRQVYDKTWHIVEAQGRPGWVVGERWLQDGHSSYDYEYGNVWTSKGQRHHCLLVVYWPTMKPVKVPDDGYRVVAECIRPFPNTDTWPLAARESLRIEMADWPRDEKGRWVKKS